MITDHLREYESGNQQAQELEEEQEKDGFRILKTIYR
jgi:hypothetical protein